MYRRLNLATGRYEYAETAEETRRRIQPRKFFPKKADWAQDQADSKRREAGELRFKSSNGSRSTAAQKFSAVDRLLQEARKFDRLAVLYREKGI